MSRLSYASDVAGVRPQFFQARKHGALLACLLASIGLHAVVLALLPVFLQGGDDRTPAVRVLDVVLLQPVPLPAAAVESPAVETPVVEAPAVEPPAVKPPISRPIKPEAKPAAKSKTPPAQPKIREASALEEGSRQIGASEPQPSSPLSSKVAPAAGLPASSGATADPKVATTAPMRTVAPLTPPVFNAAYLRNPPPRYPPAARRNGEQGTVILKVLVTQAGVPTNIDIEKSSGSSHLDRAALQAVQAWRFVPAQRGAQPVEAWVLVPIVFRLEG